MPDGSAVWEYDKAPFDDATTDLLAQQPSTLPTKKKADPEWWGPLYNHLEARRNALRTWRWSWLLHWQVLAAFFLPRRWQWLTIVANRMWKGAPINDQIVDSTPLQSVRICASSMMTGLMPDTRVWFQLGIALPWVQLSQKAKEWLEDASQRINVVLLQSNWYVAWAQAMQDLTVFGTAPLVIYPDEEKVIHLYGPCPGEYSLGAGGRLTIDTLNREFTYTVLQTVDFFKLDNCPEEVQQLWHNKGASLDTELVICHSVEPNFPISSGLRDKTSVHPVPSAFTYREVYWVRGMKAARPLSIRGYYQKPFVAPRWSTVSNEPYGRSPCMDCLGDTKQIQMESIRKAEFIEKGVRPPMGADPELKNEPASILPSTITYVNTAGGTKKGFWALFEPNAAWLQGIVLEIEKVTARIKSCLFLDVFLPITNMQGVEPRNELELTKRGLEALQQIGPVINLIETEGVSPAINIVYDIMRKKKMFLPMPEELRGMPLRVEYQSIMRMAQQSAEAVNLKDFLASMGAASTAAKAGQLPDPLRIVNLEEWGRQYADATHVKSRLLYSKDEVQEHDQARAAAMQKAHEQVQAPQTLAATVDAAKNLGNTPLGNGTVLDSLLGARPPGG